MVKKSFQIEGMHCTSCSLSIDEELEELKGVNKSRTSYAKQLAEVEYDEGQVSEATITATIGRLGYTAKVKAGRG